MKKIPILLSFLALVSCSSNIPSEITTFLSGCSLANAKEKVTTISYSYSSNIIDLKNDNKELGTIKTELYWDNSITDNFYKYQVSEYTGDCISQGESNLYETKVITYTHLNSHATYYYQEKVYYGYETNEKTGEIKEIKSDPIKYQINGIKDQIYSIFATEYSGGLNISGLYYADYFTSNSKYYMYMSLSDDKLSMILENYPYKNSQEEGLINQTTTIDNIGMLTNITQYARNSSTYKATNMKAEALYNIDIDRSLTI